MKQKIENRNENKQNELLSTSTSIQFEPESLRSIQRCSFLTCSQQAMEEYCEESSITDLQTSFRRDFICSQAQDRNQYNPNLKKSKILLVQIDNHSSSSKKSRHQLFEKEAEQLAEIERETQELVRKEKQQRKRLKLMKQLYLQKVEELKQQQLQREEQTRQFSELKSEMVCNKQRVLQQKKEIEIKLKQMQQKYESTKEEIAIINQQKQSFLNRVELLQANFNFEEKEIVIQSEYLEEIDRKIQIVQHSILRLKNEHVIDYCKIGQFLEVKCQLMEKRMEIIKEESKRREETRIRLFNQILLSRNTTIERKNLEISSLKRRNIVADDEQKQLIDTASSSFFAVKQQKNTIQQQDREDENEWDQIKMKSLFSIKLSALKGYEESYEALERIVMGMLHIFEGQYFEMADISNLIDITLDRLTRSLVEKARSHVRQTSLLLTPTRPQ